MAEEKPYCGYEVEHNNKVIFAVHIPPGCKKYHLLERAEPGEWHSLGYFQNVESTKRFLKLLKKITGDDIRDKLEGKD